MKSTKEWISISDMMTGLMMVFLLISVFYMYQREKELERENKEKIERRIKEEHKDIEQIKTAKRNFETIQTLIKDHDKGKKLILDKLKKEFKGSLQSLKAEIIDDSLTVRFVSPDIMFQPGSSSIKPKFKKILSDFCPRYFSLLYEMRKNIEEIRIEGHTSHEWEGVSKKEAYFKNMELSQDRARAVLTHCVRLQSRKKEISSKAISKWLIKKLTANGLSSSRPTLCNRKINNQKTCNDRNRRVEFRIQVNESVLLNKIIKTVKEIFSQSLSPKKEQPEEQNKK